MLRYHTQSWEHEVAKASIVLFAILLLLLLFASVAADDPQKRGQPRELPGNIQQWATPMIESQDDSMRGAVDEFVSTMNAWEAIQFRKTGALDEAKKKWAQLRLPGRNETWRKTAIAEVLYAQGDFAAAASMTREAIAIEPSNAIAHYLLGRIELAMAAEAYPQIELERPHVRFAGFYGVGWSDDRTGPLELPADLPVPRDVHELDAVTHLNETLRFAGYTDLEQPLMGKSIVAPRPGDMAMPIVSPTVADWLAATDFGNYEADAHALLGRLLTKQGYYDQAEVHLDGAAWLGRWVAPDYIRLGNAQLDLGNSSQAERLLNKAARQTLKQFVHAYAEQWDGLAGR